MELKIGDKIKDNDPRMAHRILEVIEVSGDRVMAVDNMGFARAYQRKRIYTDGKPRRTGFSVVPNA